MKKLFFFTLLANLCILTKAQEYPIPTSGHDTVTTCSGFLTDDGGTAGPNSLGADGYVTIYPENEGEIIQLLIPEDGYTTSLSDITFYFGDDLTTKSLTYSSIFDVNDNVIYGNEIDGSITVRFDASPFAQADGFAMEISCLASYPEFDFEYENYSAPDTIIKGRNISTGGNIRNNGDVISNFYDVKYYLSEDSILDINEDLNHHTRFGESINPDRSVYFTTGLENVPSSVEEGNYYIFSCVDASMISPETDETNNCGRDEVVVLNPFPGLKLTETETVYDSISVNSTLQINFEVENDGYVDIEAETPVEVFISTSQSVEDALFSISTTLPEVNLYSSESVELSVDLKENILNAGQYFAIISIDPDSTLGELYTWDNNGVLAFILTLPTANNFSISSLLPDTIFTNPFDFINLDVEITNFVKQDVESLPLTLEVIDANANVQIQSDYELETIFPLEVAEYTLSEDLTLYEELEEGIYQIIVTLDPENSLSDLIALDNSASIVLVVDGSIPTKPVSIPESGNKTVQTCAATITANLDENNRYSHIDGTLTIIPTEENQLLNITFDDYSFDSGDAGYIFVNSISDSTLIKELDFFDEGEVFRAKKGGDSLIILIESDGQTSFSTGPLFTVSCVDLPDGEIFIAPSTGEIEVSTCEGVIYDSGFMDDYGSSENGTITISPDNSGNSLQLEFVEFNTEEGYDDVTIFEDGNEIITLDGTAGMGYTYTASSPNSTLSLQLNSDIFSEESGYVATIRCLSVVGVNHSTNVQFDVYPNPVSDILTINTEEEIRGIRITAIDGSKVASFAVSNNNQIDVSELPSGVYILSIESTSSIHTSSFTKH